MKFSCWWRLVALLLCSVVAYAGPESAPRSALFVPIATFDVIAGNGSAVAEIIDVSKNGKQAIYTDADNNQIGFIDISRPRQPMGTGVLDVPGEPTSLAIAGQYILVAVNTSPEFDNPAGQLLVIHRLTRRTLVSYDLGGQPDSIALSPDGNYAAVVIENERDEDENNGLIPQAPSGGLLVLQLQGNPRHWSLVPINLSEVMGVAFAGGDLEPEYIDINERNQAVVSFQENNHLAVIDLVKYKLVGNFSAGSVMLTNVDTAEEDLINLDSSITKRREPDAVAWISADQFATANEGDYEDAAGNEGGGRGFTIFSSRGDLVYESAEAFEHLLVSAGHYNEGRSENKGVEPEAVEFGVYGQDQLLFVASERSNAVAVYEVSNPKHPDLQQVLPTGIRPEGLKAIPKRNLFLVGTEADAADSGIPTMVNIYKRRAVKRARYPRIVSADDANGLPIPWVALSGLIADPYDNSTLYAVSDSFLAEGFIYTIDASTKPAVITDRIQVDSSGLSAPPDLEGITIGPDGTFWLASEGRSGTRPNAIIQTDSLGNVLQEITLPDAFAETARNNGFEGIAVTGKAGAEVVYVAIQRAWPNAGDTDRVNTKIGKYAVQSEEWTFVHYPLESEGAGGWIGLSELTLLPNGEFAVIERDKGWGPTTGLNAELKAVFKIDLAQADFRPYVAGESNLVTIDKSLLVDALPFMARRSIWTAEKLEGFAVNRRGKTFFVTDNDGVDDAPGETLFFSLGNLRSFSLD
ncbi:MAG: esterase-like activity of phytase family protein [Gammaproteobacteria bacterium]|nr:esterase-like activity of phytase family protein [Gammaproteobacteria bacterium]